NVTRKNNYGEYCELSLAWLHDDLPLPCRRQGSHIPARPPLWPWQRRPQSRKNTAPMFTGIRRLASGVADRTFARNLSRRITLGAWAKGGPRRQRWQSRSSWTTAATAGTGSIRATRNPCERPNSGSGSFPVSATPQQRELRRETP